MYELTLQQKVESFYQSCTQGVPPPEGAREWFLRFLAGVFPRKSDGGSGGAMLRPLANLSLNFRLHLLLSFRCERGCTNLVLDELDRGHWMDQWHWLHAEPEVHDGFLLDALEQVLESTANLAARANEVKAIERLIKRRLFSHGHNAAEEIEDVVNVSLVDLNNKTPGLPHEPWPEVIGSVLRFHPVLTPVNVTSMRALVSSRAVFDVLNFVSAHVVRDAERELFLRWLVAKQLHVVHFDRLRRGEDELRVHCVRLCAAAMGTALALPLLPELDAAVSRARRVARQVLHVMALRIQSPANVGWLDDDAAEAASSKVVSLRFGVIGASSLNDTAGIERLYSGLGVLGAAFLPNWLKIAQYLSDSPAAADGTLWASGILTTRSRYSREGFHVPLRRIEGPEVKIGTETRLWRMGFWEPG